LGLLVDLSLSSFDVVSDLVMDFPLDFELSLKFLNLSVKLSFLSAVSALKALELTVE